MTRVRWAHYCDVHVIEAGTISDGYAFGNHPKPDPAVVAVIELTQHELEHLTQVCGHDGFGMLPEAAQAILAAQKGRP